jgi:hypothetical protein
MKLDHGHLESTLVIKIWQCTHLCFKRKPEDQQTLAVELKQNACATERMAMQPPSPQRKLSKLQTISVNGHQTMRYFAKTKDNVLGSEYEGIKRARNLDRSRYHGERAMNIYGGIQVINLINLIFVLYMSICPHLHMSFFS